MDEIFHIIVCQKFKIKLKIYFVKFLVALQNLNFMKKPLSTAWTREIVPKCDFFFKKCDAFFKSPKETFEITVLSLKFE